MFSLDQIPGLSRLPYPISGAIIRAIRTSIAILLAGITASIADGSIIKDFHFIPVAYSPMVISALSVTMVGVDKWLRERGLVQEAQQAALDNPLTEELPEDVSVVDVPAPAVNVNTDGPNPLTDVAEVSGAIDDGANPTEFDDPVEDKV